ncbi:cytosolic protein [Bacillus sp. Bva_UNVM-123]|uniref:cytosolic protein n=1 Tax=Bacillus sp. Bva_UNVM-123 TaxID=2829798 RepID=UPI00391F28EA
MKDKEQYADFSNVEKYRSFLSAQELPEGAYGSSIEGDEPVQAKSRKWDDRPKTYSAFNNVINPIHQSPQRQMEGSDPKYLPITDED